MVCHNCHIDMVKAGTYGKKRVQRYKCQQCRKRFSEPQQKPFGADVRSPAEKVRLMLHCLAEGNSVRGTARLCDVEKRTVLNILKLAGESCERLLKEKVRNVQVADLELDEVWTFVGCKQKNVRPDHAGIQFGDAYTFIALERTSKLVVAWHLGKRDRINCEDFISKLRVATSGDRWFDVSTDAFQPYENAIDAGLHDRANHAQVVKLFSHHVETGRERYSPPRFVSVAKDVVSGEPDLDRASTSHIERKNGTLRQWCKRLTRLTYAFSKRWENLHAALALHFCHYNFCREHGSLNKWAPAMAAGLTDHIWTVDELLFG